MNPQKLLWPIAILIIVILLGLGFLFLKPTSQITNPIPSPTASLPSSTSIPTTAPENLCKEDQLNGQITTEGAAGSIYATLTLINTSNTSCQVMLGNNVQASFIALNVSQQYQESIDNTAFTLLPNAKVYSQAQIPNGPQCSQTKLQNISFVYHDTANTINFKTSEDKESISIQACVEETENTEIRIWPLTTTPQS